jgi:hypothetical protein
MWQAPWWLWVMSLMACLLVSQILAWAEQHRALREISGRPDVTAKATWTGVAGNFIFALENANSHVAINICAIDIVLPFPQKVIDEGEALKAEFGITTASPGPPNEWIVRFGQLGNIETLDYEILNASAPRIHDLGGILDKYATGIELRLPFVLVFSNLGDPKRTWHSHYILNHTYGVSRITLDHVGVAEIPHKKPAPRCRYCIQQAFRMTQFTSGRRTAAPAASSSASGQM